MTNETKWTPTPGEWRACVWDPMERPHVHSDQPGARVCVAARDLPLTADDAHPMAASKKMYEALRWCVNEIRMRCDTRIPSIKQALDAAESALRAARGEP